MFSDLHDSFAEDHYSKLEVDAKPAMADSKPRSIGESDGGRRRATMEDKTVPEKSLTSNTKDYRRATSEYDEISASDLFENRLKAKMEGKSASAKYKYSSSAGSSSSTSFDKRLKAKMEGNSASAKYSSSTSFDDRLKAKMKRGTSDDTTSTFGTSPKSSQGGFESRLQAKLAEGRTKSNTAHNFSSAPRPPGIESTTGISHSALDLSTRSEGSESDFQDRLRKKLDREKADKMSLISRYSEEGRFNDILQIMQDQPSSSPTVVLTALEKLSDSLVLAHGIFESSDSIGEIPKLNDDWVKLFARCMTGYHSNNENVQLAALRTIWLILTLNSTHSYAIEFASRDDGLNAIVTSMKNHQNSKQIQHCGSGIIACLALKNPLHNKSSLLLSFENGE